jgi:hypothetical protein
MRHQLGDVREATGGLQQAAFRRLHGPTVDLDDAGAEVPLETQEPAQQDGLAAPRDAVHIAHASRAAVHKVGQNLQFCLATYECALLPQGWPDHAVQYVITTADPKGPSRPLGGQPPERRPPRELTAEIRAAPTAAVALDRHRSHGQPRGSARTGRPSDHGATPAALGGARKRKAAAARGLSSLAHGSPRDCTRPLRLIRTQFWASPWLASLTA